MFNRLFETSIYENSGTDRPSLRERYNSWCYRRDIIAITATLDRLSDRRLDMIGMRREELVEIVCDMMLRADEERQIGREIIELLEAPKTPDVARDTGVATFEAPPSDRVAVAA